MRVIGHLEQDRDARVFGDFLYVQGIENEAEMDGQRWAIWVRSDDQIPDATRLLAEFRAHPTDPRFLVGAAADKLRAQAQTQDAAFGKRVVSARQLLPGLAGRGFGPVTYALIIGSVVVFLLSQMGQDKERISGLFIAKFTVSDGFVRWSKGLQEIRHGEVWRLVTPILIHFGFMHILFNMLWLRDLGGLFEARLRSWYLALFVIVVAAISNYAQYRIEGSPQFGGMSGVVYGLIGYVWVRGRFDPAAGLHLDKQSLILALVWFVLCFTGWLGPVANTAHAAGLIVGAAWAFLDSKRR